MKKLSSFLCFLLLGCMLAFAQPQAIKYKAVVRGYGGSLLKNKHVTLRISIIQGQSGNPVYVETHKPQTNYFGVVELNIGQGIVESGTFSGINWGADDHFLKIELDFKQRGEYKLIGTSQLLSVPYALYAGSTTGGSDDDPDPANELISDVSLTGSILEITEGDQVFSVELGSLSDGFEDDDSDPTNELQALSLDGDVLSITEGNSVSLNINGAGALGGYYYFDSDNDGFGDLSKPVWVPQGVVPPDQFVADPGDCAPEDDTIFPGALEICGDNIDQDCDGVDEACPILDFDGDGYTSDVDCDDGNADINPGAEEICNGLDEDCDNEIDEGEIGDIWYIDMDDDGYGTDAQTIQACDQPSGYVAESGDCDDSNSSINPGVSEVSGNNRDDDCDGEIDETGCQSGFCDQNNDLTDGCEYDLDTNPLCSINAQDIGYVYGDDTGPDVEIQGVGEQWFVVEVRENDNSLSAQDLDARISVNSSAYSVSAKCDGCVGSTIGNNTDMTGVRWEEKTVLGVPSGTESGRDIFIKVEYRGSTTTTCPVYTLTVEGNAFNGGNTCSEK